MFTIRSFVNIVVVVAASDAAGYGSNSSTTSGSGGDDGVLWRQERKHKNRKKMKIKYTAGTILESKYRNTRVC